MFASNLSHWDRKPEYLSKFWTNHGFDGKRWPLTPFPFLAPWPSRPPAIETPPHPVSAGPLISWPKNASCSQIPPRASHASLQPRRWAMPSHRLSLRLCTAPLSCSLQHLLKLLLLSLRPSLLQLVSIVSPHYPSLRFGLPTLQPSRPIETPLRPVPAGPLISWPRNASCSRIPPRASHASLSPWRWAMPRHLLSLCLCTAPPSCSLQPLLKLSFLSLRPSLLQFVSIVSLLLNHGNPIFEPVCVFYLFLFCLYFSDRNKLQLWVPVCNLVVITTAIPLLLFP